MGPDLDMLSWLFPAALLIVGARHRRIDHGYILAAIAETTLVAALLHLPLPAFGRALVALALAIYALPFTIDQRVLQQIGLPVDASLVTLALRDRDSFGTTFMAWFGPRGWLTFAALAALAVLAGLSEVTTGGARPLAVVILVALAVLAVMVVRRSPLPPVPNLARALAVALRRQLRSSSSGFGLETGGGRRLPVPVAAAAAPTGDVVILICESLSGSILASAAGVAATPRLQRFQREMADRLVEMRAAMCNSTASEVSYPSILTGLSPERSHADFHRAPLLWNAAKARGYRTAFFSAQSLSWAGLGLFLLDDSLDRAEYRESLQAAAMNDLGMDDRLLNRLVCADLAESHGPSFTVINHNMLHLPGLAEGPDPDQRYLGALALFDRCFGEIVDALAAAGRLERTAIFLLGDHGELPSQPGRRLYDLTDELLAVPFWVCLPAGVRHPALAANAELPVANVDLCPTVLDLIGIDPAAMPVPLSGASLLRPLPADRTLIALNTGDLRRWDRTPFAVSWKGERVIFHDDGVAPELSDAWRRHLLDLPGVGTILVARGHIPGVTTSPHGIVAEYDHLARMGDRAELHKLDNWVSFDIADWKDHCRQTVDWIGVRDGDRVFESGCGAGAFLAAIQENRRVTVSGMDLSSGLIEIARRRVPGDYWVGDVQDLSVVASASQDVAVAHAVFVYMAAIDVVERAAAEMVRIVRPGGRVYIGILNDPDRQADAPVTNGPSGNWILSRAFWTDFAARRGLALRIVDQDSIYTKRSGYDAHARVRYSVCLHVPSPL